jgi:serine/threonine protein kinase
MTDVFIVTDFQEKSLDDLIAEYSDSMNCPEEKVFSKYNLTNQMILKFIFRICSIVQFNHLRGYVMNYGGISSSNFYISPEDDNLLFDVQPTSQISLQIDSSDENEIFPKENLFDENDEPGDIFSIGVIFIQLATLMKKKTIKHLLLDDRKRLNQILQSNSMDSKLIQLITRMIKIKSNERPDFDSIFKVLNEFTFEREKKFLNDEEEAETIFDHIEIEKEYKILDIIIEKDDYKEFFVERNAKKFIVKKKFFSSSDADSAYLKFHKISRLESKNISKLHKFVKDEKDMQTIIQIILKDYAGETLFSQLQDRSTRQKFYTIQHSLILMNQMAFLILLLQESNLFLELGILNTKRLMMKSPDLIEFDIWTGYLDSKQRDSFSYPEGEVSEIKPNKLTDIFSLGVIFYEIVTLVKF